MPWIESEEFWRYPAKANFLKAIPAGASLASKAEADYGVEHGKCKRIKRPKVDDDTESRP